MEASLLYVSRRLATDADVGDIVEVSQVRNTRLQVTGALVASQNRFAQVLEGPRASIDALMDSIRRDPRHADVEVLLYDNVERRRFSGWSLAYSGASIFVDGLIKALADRTSPEPDPRHLRRLLEAMQEFTRASP